MPIPFIERITATVLEFSEGTGNSISKIWEMIKKGELETITNGRRRLIVVESYKRLVEQRRSTKPVPLGRMPKGRHRGQQIAAAQALTVQRSAGRPPKPGGSVPSHRKVER